MVTILSLWGQDEKSCSICQQTKPLTEYHKSKNSRDGYALVCKPCKKKYDLDKHEQLMAQPRYVVTEKKCRKCHEVKSASEFYKDTSVKCSKDRLTTWCKDCIRKDALVRASQRTYEQGRSIFMRSKYDITREEYNCILEEQNGVCAICKQPETKMQYSKVMELSVDHNHSNNQVRGLLCTDCNHAIGFLKDDIVRLENLLRYLANPPIKRKDNAINQAVTVSERALKICPHCKQFKPLTDFHKHASTTTGYKCHCKQCTKLLKLRGAKPKEIFERGFKKCSICDEIKSFENFYRSSHAKDGYGFECKECNLKREHKRYLVPFEKTHFIEPERQCAKCGEIKPSTEYHFREGKKGQGTIDRWCKDCANEAELRRPYQLSKGRASAMRKYGISIESYDELLDAQQGVCAVCKLPESGTIQGKVKMLAVDHNHQTGSVRGLLCENCNRGLGNLRDNPKVIEDAIRYLQKYTR